MEQNLGNLGRHSRGARQIARSSCLTTIIFDDIAEIIQAHIVGGTPVERLKI